MILPIDPVTESYQEFLAEVGAENKSMLEKLWTKETLSYEDHD